LKLQVKGDKLKDWADMVDSEGTWVYGLSYILRFHSYLSEDDLRPPPEATGIWAYQKECFFRDGFTVHKLDRLRENALIGGYEMDLRKDPTENLRIGLWPVGYQGMIVQKSAFFA
jgi:hypothetical protein